MLFIITIKLNIIHFLKVYFLQKLKFHSFQRLLAERQVGERQTRAGDLRFDCHQQPHGRFGFRTLYGQGVVQKVRIFGTP